MFSYYVAGDGELGFGVDLEDANEDLRVNQCRRDISKDATGTFQKRRDELHPWLPSKNILHICNVGALVYTGVNLKNTKTGKTVVVGGGGPEIYWYMARLLGTEVSYTDICVCMKEEINALFKLISPDFVLLDDMPYIRIMGEANGFIPNAVYTLRNGYDIAVSDSIVGIKRTGESMYHAVEVPEYCSNIPLLSYIGYKMGIVFNEEGVLYYGKEN